MTMDAYRHEHLRRFLAVNRKDIAQALALSLGVTRQEVLRRLGVADLKDLEIPPAAAPKRGRPPRQLDRAAALVALRKTNGAIQPAAALVGVPRMTFTRFVERHIQPWEWCYGERVNSVHAELLHKSAIAPAVAAARKYQSVGPDDQKMLRTIGFRGQHTVELGLLIPVFGVRGEIVWYQLRPDAPYRKWLGWRRSGKQRYANPTDAVAMLDVSPVARPRVLDATEPLWITEGVRKADAATSIGLACVAVLGVRMLPEATAPDWDYIGLARREVYIAFDSDVVRNPEVMHAERTLARLLLDKEAVVRVVRLPDLPHCGKKTGIDDFLAAGHGRDDLLRRASVPIDRSML